MILLGVEFDPVIFFRDFGFQIIAIILGAIYFIMQWKRKRFSYEIVSKTPLFRYSDEAVKDRIKILFDDRPVQELYLLIVKFCNNGNVPIASSDFEVSISLEFNDEAEIISNDIVELKPETLDYSVQGLRNRFGIEPTLFNKGDFLTIKFLISNFSEIVRVHGRIIGVEIIEEITKETKKIIETRYMGIFIVVLTMMMAFSTSQVSDKPLAAWIAVVAYLVFGFSLFLYPEGSQQLMRRVRRE